MSRKKAKPLLHPSAGNDLERFREGLLTVQQVLTKHCGANWWRHTVKADFSAPPTRYKCLTKDYTANKEANEASTGAGPKFKCHQFNSEYNVNADIY